MKKIMELFGKYPITTNTSSYFVTTFVCTGSIAALFDRPISEALYISLMMGATFGIVGYVKAIDKDNESE